MSSDSTINNNTAGGATVNLGSGDDAKAMLGVYVAYTQGLTSQISRLTLVIALMAMLLVGTCGACVAILWHTSDKLAESEARTARYMERADKRHWELAKYIDLSQKRSSKKAANDGESETALP